MREGERLAHQRLEESNSRRKAEEEQVLAAATKVRLEEEQRQQWLELDRRQTRERAQAAADEEARLLSERTRAEAEVANRAAIEKAKEERRRKVCRVYVAFCVVLTMVLVQDALLAKMRESHDNREGAERNFDSSSFSNVAPMVATTTSLAQ